MRRLSVRPLLLFFHVLISQYIESPGLLLATLGQLVDALTGLERILTTPIPFSYVRHDITYSCAEHSSRSRYSIHLWLVTLVYCLALVSHAMENLFLIP